MRWTDDLNRRALKDWMQIAQNGDQWRLKRVAYNQEWAFEAD